MNAGANSVADRPGASPAPGAPNGALGFDSGQGSESRPSSWSQGQREWTPGFSDWLGDRFIDFDLDSATSLERLQFRREFGDSAVFEAELCERVEQLHALQHPSLSTVRSVVRVPGKGLLLESEYTSGRRLSELLPEELGATLALDLVRQLTPVLVVLKNTGQGVAHCAIGAERVVVTREGRLVLVEHVLGSALAAMQIHPSKWRTLYGLPADRGVVAFDDRGDLIQLGFLALSVLLGRRLNPLDYPLTIEALVGESAQMASGQTAEAAWLRRWIERALQVGPEPFASAQEACDTVGELSEAGLLQPVRLSRPLRSVPTSAPVPPAPIANAPAPPPPVTVTKVVTAPTPVAAPTRPDDQSADNRSKFSGKPAPPRTSVAPAPVAAAPAPVVPTPVAVAAPVVPAPVVVASAPAAPAAAAPVSRAPVVFTSPAPVPRVPAPSKGSAASAKPRPTPDPAAGGSKPWLTRCLAALAVAEGVVIAGLLVTRPPAVAKTDLPPVATTTTADAAAAPLPPAVHVSPTDRTAALVPKAAAAIDATQTKNQSASTPADQPAAPGEQRFGGLKVSSSIQLQVLEDGKVVGSTSGPIVLSEGKHVLDLVNDTLEFRTHATTAVKAGQMSALAIPVPNGRLSINAVPWADVLIDGKPVGQTPLANLSVAIGEHEIIFRHPQLGEQRQTAVVKAETASRVSMTFQK
jgi:hypothetical protein